MTGILTDPAFLAFAAAVILALGRAVWTTQRHAKLLNGDALGKIHTSLAVVKERIEDLRGNHRELRDDFKKHVDRQDESVRRVWEAIEEIRAKR